MTSKLVQSLQKLAESGDHRAQFLFGRSLYRGRGVTRDRDTAIHWLFEAAAGGHRRARYAIMDIHRHEYRYPEELEAAAEGAARIEAITYPERPNLVAESENVQHQQRLCQIFYAEGQALCNAGDQAAAAQFFLTAAKYGHKMSQGRIASMYAHGHGVTQDSAAALYWSETAVSERPLL